VDVIEWGCVEDMGPGTQVILRAWPPQEKKSKKLKEEDFDEQRVFFWSSKECIVFDADPIEIIFDVRSHEGKPPPIHMKGVKYSINIKFDPVPFNRMKLAMGEVEVKDCISPNLRWVITGMQHDEFLRLHPQKREEDERKADDVGYDRKNADHVADVNLPEQGEKKSDWKFVNEMFPMPATYDYKDVPQAGQMNASQLEAIKVALRSSICLIQGPPGTGKTFTSAAIIYHFVKNQGKFIPDTQKILACSHSNTAIDNLAEKLGKMGVKVIRFASVKQELKDVHGAMPFALHAKVNEKIETEPEYEEVRNLVHRRREKKTLLKEDEKEKIRTAKSKISREILRKECQVIATTCSSSLNKILDEFTFRIVLMDEATQIIEPESMVPISKGAERLILVGDPKQLPPYVGDRKSQLSGLGLSLYERLINTRVITSKMLDTQYRMHPKIAEPSAQLIYRGALRNGIKDTDRVWAYERLNGPLKWWNAKCPTLFWDAHDGVEEKSEATGKSCRNRREVEIVLKIVNFLMDYVRSPEDIGIITPYKAQREDIFKALKDRCISGIQVSSVDAYQGKEKNFIIMSCVRTSTIGFVKDKRRLNVSLTRAKYGMFVVGKIELLQQSQIWYQVIQCYFFNKVVYWGDDIQKLILKDEKLPARPAPDPDEEDDDDIYLG
jgi:regulator of nonsense transcripts 1